MDQTITQTFQHLNNRPSVGIFQTNVPSPFLSLPKLQLKLLWLLHEERISGIEHSERGMAWYCLRLKRSIRTVSEAFRCLIESGAVTGKHGGSCAKKWCITLCAFNYLENKPADQIADQIPSIPYIDLSDQDKTKDKILKEAQICEQLDSNTDPETLLDNYLTYKMTPFSQRVKINTLFKTSPIGPHRKEMLIRRLALKTKDKGIGCLPGYIERCLENEREDMKNIFAIIKGKPVNVNMYEQL